MTVRRKLFTWGLIVLGNAAYAVAGTTTVNFDSVAIAAGQCTDGASYLSGFGIGFASLANGATPIICNATSGLIYSPFSAPNVFAANGSVANVPLSYELTFSQPLTSFSFVRVSEVNVASLPSYTISALDVLGNVLSSVSEPFQFGTPAVAFILPGPGIAAIRLDASAGASLSDPPLDNFTMVTPTASVPEPGSVVLGWLGLLMIGLGRYARKHD